MKKYLFGILLLLVALFYSFFESSGAKPPKGDFCIAFYNTENYFDTEDDPATQDEDFTPNGLYKWNNNRYAAKRDGLAKVIMSVGRDSLPDIIGLAEVENRQVLNDLIKKTPLSNYRCGIVHKDSPDPRGIEVALIYNQYTFKVLKSSFISMRNPKTKENNRDLLYTKGIALNSDTLHIFVSHWPSKREGEVKSEPKRQWVAERIKQSTDSILKISPNANIIVMGDFNDTPDSRPVGNTLRALDLRNVNNISSTELFNLSCKLALKGEGSYYYRKNWQMIDQIVVSGNLLKNKKGLKCQEDNFGVFKADFLIYPAKSQRPKRTYLGPKYEGGYSDHFPVYLMLEKN